MDREQLAAGATSSKSVSTSSATNSASVTVAFKPVAQGSRLGHTEHSDRSAYTLNVAGGFVDLAVPLPGNTTYGWTPSTGWSFSHADLHGDIVAITNLAGNYLWTGLSGPYGEAATTSGAAPNTGSVDTTRSWHGNDNKLTDGPIVHMGARPYSPSLGRFLAVDPIEGGCANNYTYVMGDPTNVDDISGRGIWDSVTGAGKWVWDNTGGRLGLSKCQWISLGAVSLGVAAMLSPAGWVGAALLLGSVGLGAYGAYLQSGSEGATGSVLSAATFYGLGAFLSSVTPIPVAQMGAYTAGGYEAVAGTRAASDC